MNKLSVIKIGGKVIDEPDQFEYFLKRIAGTAGKKILIHGGGKQIDRLSNRLGIDVNMLDGRRITDSGTLEVTMMVLAGLLNKKMVSLLQSLQCNAIGLTGADGNLIRSRKREVLDGVDYGWVGDIEEVNTALIIELLKNDYVPVIASLTHSGKGSMLNTNADTVAAEIAVAMSSGYETDLIYCSDVPGVLKDIHDPSSVIHEIRIKDYESLKKNNVVSKGMFPKIDNAFGAINRNVARVFLISSVDIGNYFDNGKVNGTVILK